MKSRFATLFVLISFLTSCGYQEVEDEKMYVDSPNAISEFYASFSETEAGGDSLETRTYIEKDSQTSQLNQYWNEDDRISVFCGNTLNQQYRFEGETGDESGTFQYMANEQSASSADLNRPVNIAFYPYNEDNTINTYRNLTVSFPDVQHYAPNSFGQGANSMVAITENLDDRNLKFKNVGGYLRFKFYGEDLTIKSVTLKGNNKEKLSGKALIQSYDGSLNVIMNYDASEILSLDCGSGVKVGTTEKDATEFWFVLPPVKFEKGFTITVTDTDGKIFTKTTQKVFEIKRNTVKPISSIKVETGVGLDAILAMERAALVDLYNATDGDNWGTNTNWCTTYPVDKWIGVTTNEEGRVIKLRMAYLGLKGSIPESIGNLTALEELEFTVNTGVTGPLPESIGNLKSLKKLLFMSNRLTGSIPESIGNLTLLEEINFDRNNLSGPLPESFGNLTSLKILDIRDNDISGDIPESFGNLESLTHFYGYGNQFTKLPESLGNLTSLEELSLSSNKISGNIPANIGNANKLTRLDLGMNQLSGSIPESIGNLTSLESLWLSHNQLSGSIPESIGNLCNLKYLSLSDNKLSGNIPSSIGSLTSLTYLMLFYNQLSGSIPESIGNLTALTELSLETNNLSGSIPESLGNLTSLTSLQLAYNDLSGTIPESLTRLNVWKNNWQWVLDENDGLDVTDCYLPVPENAVTDIDGNTVFLGEEYAKNELTVLYLWGTYCGNSTNFNVTLKHLYEKYKSRGLEIIGETHATDINREIDYIRTNEIPWRNCVYGYGESGIPVMAARQTPELIAIDKTGKVVFQSFTQSYFDFADWLADYFPSDADNDIYTSIDYGSDGAVVVLQEAQVGKGINLIFMGEGFVDRDMGTDGLYEQEMKKAMENFFSIEPYASLRNRFNVYAVKVVSPNAEFNVDGAQQRINMDPAVAFEYARKIPNAELNPPMVTVIYNTPLLIMRSRCRMYTDGSFVSFIMGPDPDGGILLHETGGHGFANLLDEYVEEGYDFLTLPEEGRTYLDNAWEQWGYGANVDWRNDASTVKWAHFLSDERYNGESLGLYEGSYLYGNGAYRPTENSIMRESTKSNMFNAPSREQIYKRVMRLSEGSGWVYDYEEFVKFDENSRTGVYRTATKSFSPERLKDHQPPTIIEGSWRDELKK